MDLDNRLGLVGVLILAAIGTVLLVHGIEGILAPLMLQSTHTMIYS